MLSKKSGQSRDAAFGDCYGPQQFEVASGDLVGRKADMWGASQARSTTAVLPVRTTGTRTGEMHQASAGHAQAWCGMARGSAFVAAPDTGRPKRGFRCHAKSHVVALRLKPDLFGDRRGGG